MEKNKLAPRIKPSVSVSTNTENVHAKLRRLNSGDQTKRPVIVRNPLGSLDNVILTSQNTVKTFITNTNSSTSTTITSKTLKLRTGSNSGAEKRSSLSSELKKNTTTRSKSSDYLLGDDDVFFVDALEHVNFSSELTVENLYSNTTTKEKKTPSVLETSEELTHNWLPKKPASKSTLVRRSLSRTSYKRIRISKQDFSNHYSNVFKDSLYDNEYFITNYRYMLNVEGAFVFRKSFLAERSDQDYRMTVVNWMVYIQQTLHFQETTLFVSIRMFDKLLLEANYKTDKYVLLGIVCLWISGKFFDTHKIMVQKLFSLCNGRFSKNEILTAEKDILKALNYQVNFSEPTTFLYYYLEKLNMCNNKFVRLESMFLLEVFTLLLEFSSSSPSLLACSALYISLAKEKLPSEELLKYIDSHLIDKPLFKRYAIQLSSYCKEVLKCKKACSEIVAKYSSPENQNVANSFI